jgi:hypothetical protein
LMAVEMAPCISWLWLPGCACDMLCCNSRACWGTQRTQVPCSLHRNDERIQIINEQENGLCNVNKKLSLI